MPMPTTPTGPHVITEDVRDHANELLAKYHAARTRATALADTIAELDRLREDAWEQVSDLKFEVGKILLGTTSPFSRF